MYNDTLRFCRCSSYLLLFLFFLFSSVRVTLIKFLPLRIFLVCDFFPQPQLRIARLISSEFRSGSSEGVDAPVQSTRRPQHFCFARTELIPPQILVQALSTSFEKTCKSRLRGEFFQDVVLATYVSRLLASVPFVEYRAQVWPRLGLAGARLGASSTSINDLHHVLRGPPK